MHLATGLEQDSGLRPEAKDLAYLGGGAPTRLPHLISDSWCIGLFAALAQLAWRIMIEPLHAAFAYVGAERRWAWDGESWTRREFEEWYSMGFSEELWLSAPPLHLCVHSQ